MLFSIYLCTKCYKQLFTLLLETDPLVLMLSGLNLIYHYAARVSVNHLKYAWTLVLGNHIVNLFGIQFFIYFTVIKNVSLILWWLEVWGWGGGNRVQPVRAISRKKK